VTRPSDPLLRAGDVDPTNLPEPIGCCLRMRGCSHPDQYDTACRLTACSLTGPSYWTCLEITERREAVTEQKVTSSFRMRDNRSGTNASRRTARTRYVPWCSLCRRCCALRCSDVVAVKVAGRGKRSGGTQQRAVVRLTTYQRSTTQRVAPARRMEHSTDEATVPQPVTRAFRPPRAKSN
jgi:hypothetical protein